MVKMIIALVVWPSLFEEFYFHGQQCIWRDDAWHTLIPVCEVGRNTKFARAADVHPLTPIEKARQQLLAVVPHPRNQSCPIILEFGWIRSPMS